jgi:RNA polymerase sigma-70 factor (ECF subfamily)
MELQPSVITSASVAGLLRADFTPRLSTGTSNTSHEPSDLGQRPVPNSNAGQLIYASASDEQLIYAAKSSDGRAYDELSSRYLVSVRNSVYRIVRNREDTDDVVQDALLKAYCRLSKFRESCRFSTWITRIAINTALMLLRKRQSHPEVSIDQRVGTDRTAEVWDVPSYSLSCERIYARQEAIEVMSRAVNRLPSTYRSVLDLFHLQEQSMREAADSLGISVASAKSRLFRARRILRSRLEGQHISRH